MQRTPRLARLTAVPPGVWAGVAWCAAALFPLMWPQKNRGDAVAPPPGALDSLWGQLFLLLAAALALTGSALLSRRPWPAFVLLLAGTVAAAAAWRQLEVQTVQFMAVAVALGFVAADRPRRTSLGCGIAALAVLTGSLTVRLLVEGESGTSSEPYVALATAVAWLIGNSVRQGRRYDQKLRDQAAAQLTAQAVSAERLRISRELHDMVAHSIGIIALQAGAAARIVDTQPAQAREAMLIVEHAGRETLSGLRRMLGALRRADEKPGHGEGAPLRPVEGLADIDRLAARTTAAGVHVEVHRRGKRRTLPPDIDLSAFRIIQESVTNVVRHAGTGSCRVTVDYRAEDLVIEVADRGRGAADGSGAGTGFGLAGMRERVALLHGEFTAATPPGGGFRVTARLPVPAGA